MSYHLFRLELGIITMRKTEIARFLVKPEYAFGKMGCPPRIPPDATSRLLVTWQQIQFLIFIPSIYVSSHV